MSGAWPVRAAQQRRLLFEEYARRTSRPCRPANLIRAIRLNRRVNRDALADSVATLAERHAQLRCRFERSRRPIPPEHSQRARHPVADLLFERGLYTQTPTCHTTAAIDSRMLPGALDTEARVLESFEGALAQPFDYGQPPLIRIVVGSREGGHDLVAVIVPHLVADGVSMNVIAKELKTIYCAYERSATPDLSDPGPEYHRWVADEWQHLADADEALEYWREQWRVWQSAFPTSAELGAVRRALRADRPATLCACARFGEGVFAAINECGSREKTTPHVICRAAWYIAVAAVARKPAVATWCNFANRTRETANVVGWFTNRHLIGVDCSPGRPGRDVVQDVHRAMLNLVRYGHYPLNALWHQVRRNFEVEGDRFDVGFDFAPERTDPPEEAVGTLTFSAYRPQASDLDVRIVWGADSFVVHIHSAATYDAGAAAPRLLEAFAASLRGLSTNPLSRIDAYVPAELHGPVIRT